jgi:hypothetical protein
MDYRQCAHSLGTQPSFTIASLLASWSIFLRVVIILLEMSQSPTCFWVPFLFMGFYHESLAAIKLEVEAHNFSSRDRGWMLRAGSLGWTSVEFFFHSFCELSYDTRSLFN